VFTSIRLKIVFKERYVILVKTLSVMHTGFCTITYSGLCDIFIQHDYSTNKRSTIASKYYNPSILIVSKGKGVELSLLLITMP
jgi:hypothetical protein